MDIIKPGNEPEEIKQLLDVLLDDIDKTFPDGTIVWNEWNHEKWDKAAGYLCKRLGYSKGTDFLRAYGFEIVQERETNPKVKEQSNNQQKKQRPIEDSYKPKKKNRPLLIVSIIVLLLAFLVIGGAVYMMNHNIDVEDIFPKIISVFNKKEAGPENTVSQFCDAMKAFDLDKMHSLVPSAGDIWGETSDNEMEKTFIPAIEEWASKLSYMIASTATNGDKADVTVNFKYTDATNLLKSTIAEYMTQAFGKIIDNLSEEEMQRLLGEVFQDQKGKIPVETAEASVVFPCSKTSDGWIIDEVPDEALNILTGNLLKVFEEFGELSFE